MPKAEAGTQQAASIRTKADLPLIDAMASAQRKALTNPQALGLGLVLSTANIDHEGKLKRAQFMARCQQCVNASHLPLLKAFAFDPGASVSSRLLASFALAQVGYCLAHVFFPLHIFPRFP